MNSRHKRIEPTFSGKPQTNDALRQQPQTEINEEAVDESSLKSYLHNGQQKVISLKTWWNENKSGLLTSPYFRIGSVAFIGLILVVVLLSFLFSSDDNEDGELSAQTSTENTNVAQQPAYERIHQVDFPDDFSLFATQYDGLIIHWQGNISHKNNIWHIAKAQGDKNCQAITFNNGDTYSTVKIDVENSTHYYAYFSPVETNNITKALAFRGNFNLCGYKFSLKGSQALLAKHAYYSELFSY